MGKTSPRTPGVTLCPLLSAPARVAGRVQRSEQLAADTQRRLAPGRAQFQQIVVSTERRLAPSQACARAHAPRSRAGWCTARSARMTWRLRPTTRTASRAHSASMPALRAALSQPAAPAGRAADANSRRWPCCRPAEAARALLSARHICGLSRAACVADGRTVPEAAQSNAVRNLFPLEAACGRAHPALRVCPPSPPDRARAGPRARSCCTRCGRVLDEAAFSSEVTFSKGAGGESTVNGHFVSEAAASRGLGRVSGGRLFGYQARSGPWACSGARRSARGR